MSHSSQPNSGVVNGKGSNVYETSVKLVFKNQDIKDCLSPFFKDYTVLSPTEIQFSLFFPDPNRAMKYMQGKAEETLMRWNSYDGLNA